MNLFGFELQVRRKAAVPLINISDGGGPWWPIVQEPFTGAWQRNQELRIAPHILQNPTVYATVTLIAGDMAKMCLRLVQEDDEGIWTEVESNAPFWPVLRKPNHFQNPRQFVDAWMLSKLLNGNTFIYKRRDGRGIVNALYVLNPWRVLPLEAPDGSVFYRVSRDILAGIPEDAIVPAREIIHDRIHPLFHPLCGISPLYAAEPAALLASRIQTTSDQFFANGSKPGGIVLAPGSMSQTAAERIQKYIDDNFSGNNVGKILLLTDGMKWEAGGNVSFTAVESQQLEQLKWTDEQIARAFHMPAYKVGIGPMPTYTNVEALSQEYYSDCLQILIEEFEACLDAGLDLPWPYGTEFDIDDLLRMDTATLIASEKNANGLKTVNESRKRLNLPSIEGGDTVYRQQQDFSIEALNRRDAQEAAPSSLPAAGATEVDPAPVDMKSVIDGLRSRMFSS